MSVSCSDGSLCNLLSSAYIYQGLEGKRGGVYHAFYNDVIKNKKKNRKTVVFLWKLLILFKNTAYIYLALELP